MLLDNSHGKTVFQWLEKYSEAGEMDIVTGYFTIGALAWLNENFNDKIDLLNQDIGIENALKLKKNADDTVIFLKQKNELPKLFVIDESHNLQNENVNIETREKICRVLNCDISDIIEMSENE